MSKVSLNTKLVIICGCLICLISFGVRSSMGLFLIPVIEDNNWNRETFSFAIALQNLFWGFLAPISGILADKFGNVKIMMLGTIIYAAGLVLGVTAGSIWALNTTLGILVGTGISATSFGICLPALARLVAPEKRIVVLGVATACGSAGQFLIIPLAQASINIFDWQYTFYILAGVVMLIMLLALPLSKGNAGKGVDEKPEDAVGILPALKEAFSQPSYWFVILGFYVCGFQLAFITAHMPSSLIDQGFNSSVGATSLALIGFFNIFGAYYSGILSKKFPKKWVLFYIYLGRAVAIVLFMVLPKSLTTIYTFAAFTGLLWLATVPPTTGLVAHLFGTRYMAVLYGVVFFNHQLGSFTGVWLGGYLYDTTQSYDVVWWLAFVIAVVSAMLHIPIKEKPIERLENRGVVI